MRFLENAIDPTGEFPIDAPDYALYLAFQITRRRDQLFDEALAPLGLSVSRWRAMSVIRRTGRCTMKELAHYTTIDRTTLTRSIDHLVSDGLVERGGEAGDRRMVTLALTDAGQAMFLRAAAVVVAANRKVFEGVDAQTARQVARGLIPMLRNLAPDPALAVSLLSMGPPEPPQG